MNVLCVCVTKLNFCIKSPDDRGEGHGVLCKTQGEGKEISFLLLRVTSFPTLSSIFPPPPPSPLLISVKSLNGITFGKKRPQNYKNCHAQLFGQAYDLYL